MANHNYRIQQQHIAMARKRQRRRRAASTGMAEFTPGAHSLRSGNGVAVNVRQIGAGDEGILYMHRITERRGLRQRKSFASKVRGLFSRDRHAYPDENISVGSIISNGSMPYVPYVKSLSRRFSSDPEGIIESELPETPYSPPPKTDTLRGFRSFTGKHQKQYTISSKKKYRNNCLNWLDNHHMNFVDYFCHKGDVESNVYRPSTYLYRYIDWTFTAGFTAVFLTFLFFYCILCLAFGGLLLLAGEHEPNCIVAGGQPFGHTNHTKFSDAFALSWTTFTTVGYGMTYTSTGGDFGDTKPARCSWVVFLCVSEAFVGLLFAGMCAAILFGKVNRVQAHANLIFCNAVCLQYEEIEEAEDPDDYGYSERSRGPITPLTPYRVPIPDLDADEENGRVAIDGMPRVRSQGALPQAYSHEETRFIDQFNGCPILKFQVVNELCNREGSELVDCIMKVVAIKFKGPDGRVTHSQYVRVNLVDFEHPFLSRVWHGVHILDHTSPLLTDRARQRIKENNGSWPSAWFDPEIIRSKLEFHDLIVTVAGISNVSAVTVHSYKRYRLGDVLIGYNFAPIVFRDIETGRLEVDLSMSQDVREQLGIRGEDLSIRRSDSKDDANDGIGNTHSSTIRIAKSKSGDGLGSVTSHEGKGHRRTGSSASAKTHRRNGSSTSIPFSLPVSPITSPAHSASMPLPPQTPGDETTPAISNLKKPDGPEENAHRRISSLETPGVEDPETSEDEIAGIKVFSGDKELEEV